MSALMQVQHHSRAKYSKHAFISPEKSSTASAYRAPLWVSGREPACQCRRHRFDPWVGKIPLEEGMTTHSSILA